MTFQERRLSVTLLGWLGAAGTAVVVAASRLDPLVVIAATPLTAFFVLAALLSSPTRRAELERRKATLRAIRRLRAVLDECADLHDVDALADSVARGLVDVLELHGCWFEPAPADRDLPEIGPDGDVTSRVRHRITGGRVLPPLVAVPVNTSHGAAGRFVLEANAAVGLSPERRHIALAVVQVCALAMAKADAR